MSEKDFKLIFSNNLKRYLQEKEMPQAKLAELLNVGATSVYNWANGIKIPRMDKVDAMCKIFNCKRSDLIEDHSMPAALSAAVPDLRAYSEKEKKFIDVYLNLSQEDKDFLEKMMFRMVPEKEIGNDDELML